ncbi:MAG: flavin-dependent monooxygenase [Betaproteobacteria bacterium]|nr:flavin-dependent monooxygenase [Betaproteobacteria bacterium]
MAEVTTQAQSASDGKQTGAPTGTRVPVAELRSRAQALAPVLRARAEQTERDRRVSVETTQMLHDADLFRLMQPARFGGFEYGFTELMDISSELARGCASSAWCYGLGVVHQWMLGAFPEEAQDEIEQDSPCAVIAGSYAPQAQALAAEGGFRIKGKWGFTSNCDNASWMLVGVMFPPEAGGKGPVPGFLLVPARECTIEDNWHTVGLAGTGSKNIVIGDELFVPRHRMLTFPQLSSSNPPGTAVNKNPIYRIPFLAGVPVSLVVPAIGVVQGALEEFLDMARVRVTKGAVSGGGNKMAEFQTIQIKVAEAAACLDAASLLLYRDMREVQSAVAAGEAISVDTRIRNRRDQAFAVKLTCQAADLLYAAVGGGGLFLSSGIQRAWRDAHAVAKHVSLNWDWVGSMYGQHRLGLEPKGQY